MNIDSSELDLPNPPDVADNDRQIDFKKIRYQAQVQHAVARDTPVSRADRQKAQDAADADATKAEWAAEFAMRQEVHKAYVDVAKGAVDRAQARAIFIKIAEGAIGTAYTVLIGLLPKGDGGGKAAGVGTELTLQAMIDVPGSSALPVQIVLPSQIGPPVSTTQAVDVRGSKMDALLGRSGTIVGATVPTFFLALSIVLTAVYLAYLVRGAPIASVPTGPTLWEQQHSRLVDLLNWIAAGIYQRVRFLHAAVVSLGVGVTLLPLAFFQPTVGNVIAIWFVGMVLVLLVPQVVRQPAAN